MVAPEEKVVAPQEKVVAPEEKVGAPEEKEEACYMNSRLISPLKSS